MQAALDAWFTALSTIAVDGLVRQPEDPLAADAAKAAALDAEAGRAVSAIGGLLVMATKGNWRAPQTAGAIRAADSAVQVLLRSLADSVGAREDADAALYAPLEAETRDDARQAIRDLRLQREAELEPHISAFSAYKRVLAQIGEGHALLLDRASRLSQAETARRLRVAEEALRRALVLLPRGPLLRDVVALGIASPRSWANEVVSRRFRAHGAIVNPSGSACFVSSCLSAEPGFRPALADWPAPRRAWGGTHA